jgi:hypothetical protein
VPSGNNLVIAGTLRFDHSIDVPIHQIHYNKIIFKRSTSGTTGTPTALTDGTVAITPNLLYTEFNDTSGAVTYAYKTQYLNSVSGDVSSESDWFIPGGPSYYSLQKIRQRGRSAIYDTSIIKSEDDLTDWTNEWIEQMTNKAVKANEAYSQGTTAYSFGTAGLGTVTEPLFKYATKVEITTDGVSYTKSTEIPMQSFSDIDVFSSNAPRHAWINDTVFQVLPKGAAGTVRMTLGKIGTPLSDDADELPQFLRGYTTGCVEYLQYRAYDLDQKDALADKHYNRYLRGQIEFVSEITPRDQTGVKTIEFEEELSGNDDPLF